MAIRWRVLRIGGIRRAVGGDAPLDALVGLS